MTEKKKETRGRKPTDTVKTTISIQREVDSKIRKAAELENRTFSNFLETLMMQYIREHEM